MIERLPADRIEEVAVPWRALFDHHAALPEPPGFRTREVEAAWARRLEVDAAALAAGEAAAFVHRTAPGAIPDGLAVVTRIPDPGRAVLGATGPHGELKTLVVAPEARGTGVGRALLEVAVAWLREGGAVAMHVGVRAGNDEAVAFYRRAGARDGFVTLVQDLAADDGPAGADRGPSGGAADRDDGAERRARGAVERGAAGRTAQPHAAAEPGRGALPEADLGVWRTPVEAVPRLAERLGLGPGDLLVKRDDWLAHGGGGNKLRKLARLCGAALHEGADVLVTSGAAQSNHARATAAAARRLGLDVVLVLAGDGPGEAVATPGNLALDGLLGARVVWAGPVGEAGHASLDERLAATVAELRAEGRRPYLVPYGGSSALGASAYEDAAREIDEQAPGVAHVVCAMGSGGTLAGLVAGLGADRVVGVDVGAVAEPDAAVAALLAGLGPLLGREVEPAATRLRRDQVGDGYGSPTAASRAAMDHAAHDAGLLLDPVYSSKALAGLAAEVAEGRIRRGELTVFVHTGGLPGIFGHPMAAELAARTGG